MFELQTDIFINRDEKKKKRNTSKKMLPAQIKRQKFCNF